MSIVGTDVFLVFPRAETTTKVGDHRTSGNRHTRLSEPSPAPAKVLGEELTISRTDPFSCTGEGAGRGVNNIKN